MVFYDCLTVNKIEQVICVNFKLSSITENLMNELVTNDIILTTVGDNMVDDFIHFF